MARKQRKAPTPAERLRNCNRLIALYQGRFEQDPTLTSRRDYYDYLSECWHHVTRLLVVAQTHWRHSLGSPSAALRQAVELARRAAILWEVGHSLREQPGDTSKTYTSEGFVWASLPQTPEVVPFRFATTCLVASLLEGAFAPGLTRQLPVLETWRQCPQRLFLLNYPDAALVNALQTGQCPASWEDLLAEFSREKFDDLFLDTYRIYLRLIAQCHRSDWTEATKTVALLQDYFAARPSSPYFAHWDGGEEGNPHCVDFRLSTIVRWFARANPALVNHVDPILVVPLGEP
jgi:hypothetical protein